MAGNSNSEEYAVDQLMDDEGYLICKQCNGYAPPQQYPGDPKKTYWIKCGICKIHMHEICGGIPDATSCVKRGDWKCPDCQAAIAAAGNEDEEEVPVAANGVSFCKFK
jgi:hypothetical protein